MKHLSAATLANFRNCKTALIFALLSATSQLSVAGDYQLQCMKQFNFVSSSGSVKAGGTVGWYRGDIRFRPDVNRFQYMRPSWVMLQRGGCLHVRISYKTLTGSVSWPPSVASQNVTDGYYVYCNRAPGTWVDLSGMNDSGALVQGTTISIGYSNAINLPRREDATHTFSCTY